jgi:hypothetical protein
MAAPKNERFRLVIVPFIFIVVLAVRKMIILSYEAPEKGISVRKWYLPVIYILGSYYY